MTRALPGATAAIAASMASRSSFLTTSAPALTTTARVPPPNITGVATRSVRSAMSPRAALVDLEALGPRPYQAQVWLAPAARAAVHDEARVAPRPGTEPSVHRFE